MSVLSARVLSALAAYALYESSPIMVMILTSLDLYPTNTSASTSQVQLDDVQPEALATFGVQFARVAQRQSDDKMQTRVENFLRLFVDKKLEKDGYERTASSDLKNHLWHVYENAEKNHIIITFRGTEDIHDYFDVQDVACQAITGRLFNIPRFTLALEICRALIRCHKERDTRSHCVDTP